ncbi:MAG: hypothetical protein KGO94_10415, partial [Alphaproteobacteria bacterium]|nr:hypothetical protein [Alphaproteobacteria bacterium]
FTTGNETTGDITIIKQALYNGNHITDQSFTGKLTCDGAVTPFTFKDGKVFRKLGIPIGANCTVVEDPSLPMAGHCPTGQDASWFTTYNPATLPPMSALGVTVTVTNDLRCAPRPDTGGILSIKKEVVSHAELPLGPMQFAITANCTGNPNPTMTQSLGDGETKPFQTYVPGTSCTVQESPAPATNACGLMTPQWTTEIIPPTTITSFQNGGTVIVRNTLDCSCPKDQKSTSGKCVTSTFTDPICTNNQRLENHLCVENLPPPKLVCDAATAAPAGDLCRCRFDNMTQSTKTSCQCQQGFTLQAGKGCIKEIVQPTCKLPQIYNLANNSCITPRPVCTGNTHFDANAGRCVENRPNCKPPKVYNPATNSCITPRPTCNPPKVYNKATNSCVTPRPVCGPNQTYNAKRNMCVNVEQRCPQGTIKLRGTCIAIPRCPPGTLPMPGTGICLPLKIDRPPQGDGPVRKPQGGIDLPGIRIPGL